MKSIALNLVATMAAFSVMVACPVARGEGGAAPATTATAAPATNATAAPAFDCQDQWNGTELTCIKGTCGGGEVCQNDGKKPRLDEKGNPVTKLDKDGKAVIVTQRTCQCVPATPVPEKKSSPSPAPEDVKTPCDQRAQCGGNCFRVKVRGVCQPTTFSTCECVTGVGKSTYRGLKSIVPYGQFLPESN